jgi:hypothetical protein
VKNPILSDVLVAKCNLAVSYNLKMQIGLARSDRHDKPKGNCFYPLKRYSKERSDGQTETIQTPSTVLPRNYIVLKAPSPPMKPLSTDKTSVHMHQLPDSACGYIYERSRKATLPTRTVDLNAT